MIPQEPSYTLAQRILHWLIAAIVVVTVPVGLIMTNVLGDGPVKNTLFELHKSFGLIVFALALLRIAVRWRYGAPPLVPGMPDWQRHAAHVSHAALYMLIVLVPLAGWAGTSACCAPVNVFWTLPVTLPIEGGMERAKTIFPIHIGLALTLTALVFVHAGAALHHHLVRRDGTLRRMWPGAP